MLAEEAAPLVVFGYVCAVRWAGLAARAEGGRVTDGEEEEGPVACDGLVVLFSNEWHGGWVVGEMLRRCRCWQLFGQRAAMAIAGSKESCPPVEMLAGC